jgi:hypothetical protein
MRRGLAAAMKLSGPGCPQLVSIIKCNAHLVLDSVMYPCIKYNCTKPKLKY